MSWDLESILRSAGVGAERPGLVEVARTRGSRGLFWWTGRIVATVWPERVRLRRRLGVIDGGRVRVVSAVGAVEIAVVVSPDIRPGVVAIHQFWGHTYESGTRTSRRYPGVNVNILHDDRVRDRFCGMPVFNGTPVRVEPLIENGS